ncbi:MAG TPA: hypothetical protein VLX28_22945 [Thermoanaerobaculia bacterium]|nr:hypothetical protein [Thermoanaerobaculia bacterium]
MKKLTPLLFALGFACTAMLSVPASSHAQACTLLCIQGYHCCIHGNNQTCIPDSEACK